MKMALLILCALFTNESLACSCVKPVDMPHMESSADFVVLAQLKKIPFSMGSRKYVFATIKTFKGETSEQLEVRTSRFEVSCGLRVRRDVPYVLFVYREGGKLTVDHCSSWPLTKEWADYTTAFNEFYGLIGTEALGPRSSDQVGILQLQHDVRGAAAERMGKSDLPYLARTSSSLSAAARPNLRVTARSRSRAAGLCTIKYAALVSRMS